MAYDRCALTGKSGKFVKSHLLPKALTRPEEPGLPLIQSASGQRAIIRRDSWYDKSLVTKEGEFILADLDNWAIKFLRKSKLVWSGWEGQYLQEPIVPIRGTPNGIRTIDIDDPELLRLFFLSLLWRAAATNRPEFNEIALPEEKLSKLGRMLVDRTEKPHDFFPISLVQLSTRGLQHNHSPILQTKKIPDIENEQIVQLPVFRFYLDGLIIHLDHKVLSSGRNSSSSPTVVGANKKLVVATVKYEESFQRTNLLHIMGEAANWPQGFKPHKT